MSSIFFRFAETASGVGIAASVFIAEEEGRGSLRCLGGMGRRRSSWFIVYRGGALLEFLGQTGLEAIDRSESDPVPVPTSN